VESDTISNERACSGLHVLPWLGSFEIATRAAFYCWDFCCVQDASLHSVVVIMKAGKKYRGARMKYLLQASLLLFDYQPAAATLALASP